MKSYRNAPSSPSPLAIIAFHFEPGEALLPTRPRSILTRIAPPPRFYIIIVAVEMQNELARRSLVATESTNRFYHHSTGVECIARYREYDRDGLVVLLFRLPR